MSTCTFFGHRNCTCVIKPDLEAEVTELVKKGVDHFYVGAEGNFDNIVIDTLIELRTIYPHIECNIVLSKFPGEQKLLFRMDTIIPEGIEKTPPKYGIDKRNRWMLDRSDYVVGYVTHSYGGAAKFIREAERKGKIVINIADKK